VDTLSDLTDFTLGDMVRLASALRSMSAGAATVEEYANQLCGHLHECFVDEVGTRQALLVRLYLTQPVGDLPQPERTFLAPDGLDEDARCLTLLGTAGDDPAWNDRRRSEAHLAVALTDPAQVAALPMIAGLLQQMGVDVEALVQPEGLVVHLHEHRYGVFHVPEAAGSDLIPAQQFVREYGVRSVLGFGGVLPDGDMYAVVMFSRVPVPRSVAELLETLSPSITLGLVEMLDRPVFVGDRSGRDRSYGDLSAVREGLLRGLLEVHERVAAQESDAARLAVAEAVREGERSATLARTLQASLLPPELPRISGLQTAAAFRPAGDGSEVGGDFYDLFPVRRGVWGLVLGDVSGKGAGAASLTALARHTVRAAALRAHSCMEVLRVLNDAVYLQDIAAERYLTALYAVLRRRDDVVEVEVCLAGHPPPLLLRPGQPAEEVGATGQPMGLFRAVELAHFKLEMRKGDTLVAFTDGVTEARRKGELFGDTRVHATLSALAGRPVGDIVRGLTDAVEGFQGHSAADDIAVVGLQSTR
jgi:serine phosphatase RsbU (regulator of sigma subunit)